MLSEDSSLAFYTLAHLPFPFSHTFYSSRHALVLFPSASFLDFRMACVDLCPSRPGLPSRASAILLDSLAQERRQLDNLCRERLVGVPGEQLLLALGSTAHRLVDVGFSKNVL